MRWNRQPSDLVERTRLRRAALRYARYGWPVLPGGVRTGDRFVCGRPGCPTVGVHPAADHSEATADLGRVARHWQDSAHAVLLPTGRAFDVLDVPTRLGRQVLDLLRLHAAVNPQLHRGPVASTPTGRYMFLVRVGDPLCPELESCLDVVRHSEGSWIPAPPTRMIEGRVRWVLSPEEALRRLPDSYPLQELVVDALGVLRRPTRTYPQAA
jgi:hypothetical protein